MLNEFGSYADTLDNTKPDLSRKNHNLAPDRSNCYPGNGSDIGPRAGNLSVPTATWNCNPYLGNFYNYYGNNSYDTSDVHQYDNRKCSVNQFSPRSYTQHAIQSASVLQCCDPRCQLFSEHSKYPFSNTLANKYNNQRNKPAKNCYDALEQTTTASPTTPTPLKSDKTIDRSKYPSFAYAPMQPSMNKFNGQQPPSYNAIYQNSIKPSKHVFLPSPEPSSFGDYYTDTGKPSYWNKQNSSIWNRGISNSYYPPPPPPPPPPPSSFDHVDKMQQKMTPASGVAHHQHEQNNVTAAAAAAAAANPRGILFNRLLDHRNRALYDASYLPNYHYGRPPPPPLTSQSHKNSAAVAAAAYYQSYQDREMYTECSNPSAGMARVPTSTLQNSNSYQSPLPMYNVHYVDPTAAVAASSAVTAHKETKDSKSEENKNRLLDKNPNLDVREFLSTWDDVEDDKAPEPEAPVIVLDCTSLEAEALAKVKEKLAENIADCSPIENPSTAIEFTSHAANATVLKVIDDQIVSPHASVIQESVVDNSFAAVGSSVSKKDQFDDHHSPNKSQADSSHSDGYNNMWYGTAAAATGSHKKKDDLSVSYDFIEMTERIVNTVGQLMSDEKSSSNEKDNSLYEPHHHHYHHHHHHHKEAPEKTTEDEWNINFSYKRNKTAAPHGLAVPEPRYNRPVKDDVNLGCKTYVDEPEKNVSCSFNLQKTSNDLKFSVNYTKQTECHAARVQDYSVKCKTVTNGSGEKNERYKPTTQQRMEDYSYKNYYNSYYCNNPNYEYMQMHNVKECTYDVENIDREISNDNATDITLVKADLEKSLNEITHQFSYQKKIENVEKELPKEKPPPPPYDYRNSQHYLNDTTAKNDLLEMPKLDNSDQDLKYENTGDNASLGTSVIQKTGSCNEKPIYDERDDLYNDNSMLSMPSLSPPPTAQENRSISAVGLTLNDVYEDEVIFDTSNKPSHNEEKESAGEENCLNFLNIVKNDDKRESVVYPLNLALTKDKDQSQSMVKFTNSVDGDNQEELSVDSKEPDTVSKVDDGYYSVENHYDKDNKSEFDNQDNESELKSTQADESKNTVYKTCIVSREQYKQPNFPQTDEKLPPITNDCKSESTVEKSTSSIADPCDSNSSPSAPKSNYVSVEEESKSPEREIDTLSDVEYRDKLLDDSSKFHNSSTDEEKLLKSSKFKKYKKLKKMKIKELENMQELNFGVIKENGNVTNFKNIFPSMRCSSVEKSCKNEIIGDKGKELIEKRVVNQNDAIPFEPLSKLTSENDMNGHSGSLPVLVTGDEIDDLEHAFKAKKRKFASSVKDADLPVKKRKQGMAGIEQNFTDSDKNHQSKEMESVPVEQSSLLCTVDATATIATATETETASEGSNDKHSLNGKYQVDTRTIELADQKITAEPEPPAASVPSSVFNANDVYCRQKLKKKHKKDKDRVKIKISKKQKKKEKLLYERRKSLSYNDNTLESPDQTMLDDVFNDPYKFHSSGSEQVCSWSDEGNETHSHAITDHDDGNVEYVAANSISTSAAFKTVDDVAVEVQNNDLIAGNLSVVVNDHLAVAAVPASNERQTAKINSICENFNDKSTYSPKRINSSEDKHKTGESRKKYNWSREKHALSDGENYTSSSHKKLKSNYKHALSDDECHKPFCSIFKPKFIDEPRQNSVISFFTQPPSTEFIENELVKAPELEQTSPESHISNNVCEEAVQNKHKSPKIDEILKSPSPVKEISSSDTIQLSPQLPKETTAPDNEEPDLSIETHSSEPIIIPNEETAPESLSTAENHEDSSVEELKSKPNNCDSNPNHSPHVTAPNSPYLIENKDVSTDLVENLELHHEVEHDLVQHELPCKDHTENNDQAFWSEETSSQHNSHTQEDIQEKLKNVTLSCENSPSINFAEEYEPQFVTWSPGPVVGECTVETSQNENELQEEEEEEEEGERVEHEDTSWCENSPFQLDDNIDHEEAICNVAELDKSIWSNDNTPIVSDDELETCIPSCVLSPAVYEHNATYTNRSPPSSPYHSDVESPKGSSSSSSSSSSSDSDQSDVEDNSTRHSKASSSKSPPSSKTSHVDSSDDETYEKSSSNKKYNADDEESFFLVKDLCKDNSDDEYSVCDDDVVNKLDDLFNIPSVAPTPHCDLNREEEDMDESVDLLKDSGRLSNINSKAPSPNCILHEEEISSPFCVSNNIILNNHLPVERPYYDSDRSSVSSVAPSPKCDIIDGVLLDDTSRISDGFGFDKSYVPSSPLLQPTSTVAETEPSIMHEEVPSLRELAASALAKLSISSVPSFNRNNLLEVWVTPERTEIIIHSEDNEPSQTDLVINDNQVMITDAYGDDEDVNIATNFDQIKDIAFDYSTICMESSIDATNDKTDEELQCQCLIISSEESVVCLRCSLNSSIIVNQDLDIESNYAADKPTNDLAYENDEISIYENENQNELCDPSTFIPVNCIEDSFIDHKILVTPERITEEVIHTECLPIDVTTQTTEDQEADDEVQNITNFGSTSDAASVRNPRHVQLKVQLPWHKIFNLNQTNNSHQDDQNVLELGPAKIQVRLSPDNPSLMKLVDLEEERVSPVVKVKRLVLQRASDFSEKLPFELYENNEITSPRKSTIDVAGSKENTSRLPKMVIKKTNLKEYKSFLQMNTLQPVVKLYKNKSLDELAKKMCKLKSYSINLQKFNSLSCSDDAVVEKAFKTEVVSRNRKSDQNAKPMIPKVNSKHNQDERDEPVNPALLDMSTKCDLAPIPESHHCLLCHRSFPSEDSYRIHMKGRFHRHLELTQRKTIHAMYRHFTGHICPRLRPLSAKERKKMKWKPRSANVNHFYHEKTPLQIALHKSVFESKPDAKYS